MNEHEQAAIRREVEEAMGTMPDRDRVIFSLGYVLGAKHSRLAVTNTLTAIKNSAPSILGDRTTVRK